MFNSILTRRVSLLAECKSWPCESGIICDKLKLLFFSPHLYSWCIFISVTDLSLSLTHAPPPLHLQIHCSHLPAMIQVPGVPLTLSSIGCLIDGSPQAREPARGHLSENAHPPAPLHLPQHPPPTPIYPSLQTFIHPSIRPHQPPTLQP